MAKFGKVFNVMKIALTLMSVVLLYNTTLYSYPLPKDCLRVPVGEKNTFLRFITSSQEVKFNWASDMEDWVREQLSNAQKKNHFIEEIASKALKRDREEVSIDYADISLLSKGRLHKYSYLVKIKLKTGELVTVVIKSYKFNRQNRFEKEIEALQFLGPGNVPEYYGSWVDAGEDIKKNQRLDENNYMLFAESFEEGLTLEDYIESIKGSSDYQEKAKRALVLAIKKYTSIQQKSAGKFQLVNLNPKNIIIYESPNGKLRAKVIDIGGQMDGEDLARWLSDIKEKLIGPIIYPNTELRYAISDKTIFSIVKYIFERAFLAGGAGFDRALEKEAEKTRTRLRQDAHNLFLFSALNMLRVDLDFADKHESAIVIFFELFNVRKDVADLMLDEDTKRQFSRIQRTPIENTLEDLDIEETDIFLLKKKISEETDILKQQSLAKKLAKILSVVDISSCESYKEMVKASLKRDIPDEDMLFILASVSDALLLQDNMADKDLAINFVLNYKYPVFLEAKTKLQRVNASMHKNIQYDESYFWKKNFLPFSGLLAIHPDLGKKLFARLIATKQDAPLSEDLINPIARMNYLLESLECVLGNKDIAKDLSLIIDSLMVKGQRNLNTDNFLDLLYLINGCVLLKVDNPLKGIKEDSFEGIANAVGYKIVKNLMKSLNIERLNIDEKVALNNWLGYNISWDGATAFAMLYDRFSNEKVDRQRLYKERDLLRDTIISIFEGKYEDFRYGGKGEMQLSMLDTKQRLIWKQNSGKFYKNTLHYSDLRQSMLLKYVEDINSHIKDSFVHEQIDDLLINFDKTEEKLILLEKELLSLGRSFEFNRREKSFSLAHETVNKIRKLLIVKDIIILISAKPSEFTKSAIRLDRKRRSVAVIVKALSVKLKNLGVPEEEISKVKKLINTRASIDSGDIFVEDTDNASTMAAIGEKPQHTCMGYTDPRMYAVRCLPAYIADADKKAVIVQERGVPKARGLIRLVNVKIKDKMLPVILLESVYPFQAKDSSEYVLTYILEKATAMGIPVAVNSHVIPILDGPVFMANAGPFELAVDTKNSYDYSDTYGQEIIAGEKIVLDKEYNIRLLTNDLKIALNYLIIKDIDILNSNI